MYGTRHDSRRRRLSCSRFGIIQWQFTLGGHGLLLASTQHAIVALLARKNPQHIGFSHALELKKFGTMHYLSFTHWWPFPPTESNAPASTLLNVFLDLQSLGDSRGSKSFGLFLETHPCGSYRSLVTIKSSPKPSGPKSLFRTCFGMPCWTLAMLRR